MIYIALYPRLYHIYPGMDPLAKSEIIKSLNLVSVLRSTSEGIAGADDSEDFLFRLSTLVNAIGTEMVLGIAK